MAVDELYKEIILDHYKSPRNKRELPGAGLTSSGNNPLCGDEITVFANVEDGKITDLTYQGAGCSISQSSASMMSAAVKGKTLGEVQALTRAFKGMMSIHEHSLDGDGTDPADAVDREVKLGDLEALRGVVKFPVRIKCATLSWNTLLQALDE